MKENTKRYVDLYQREHDDFYLWCCVIFWCISDWHTVFPLNTAAQLFLGSWTALSRTLMLPNFHVLHLDTIIISSFDHWTWTLHVTSLILHSIYPVYSVLQNNDENLAFLAFLVVATPQKLIQAWGVISRANTVFKRMMSRRALIFQYSVLLQNSPVRNEICFTKKKKKKEKLCFWHYKLNVALKFKWLCSCEVCCFPISVPRGNSWVETNGKYSDLHAAAAFMYSLLW